MPQTKAPLCVGSNENKNKKNPLDNRAEKCDGPSLYLWVEVQDRAAAAASLEPEPQQQPQVMIDARTIATMRQMKLIQ